MEAETVLITGASAGIGWELAKCFAADRSRLILVARRRERLEQLAAELHEQHGVEVRALPGDLSRPETPQAIFDQLAADGVAVDVLVNNAGFGAVGAVANLPLRQQSEMIQVNVMALWELTRLFLPEMIRRGRGGVLNVGSTAAFQPGPYMAVYYATKAFVLSFTEALADELAGAGLRVTCLCPGPTVTEFARVARLEKALLFRLAPMSGQSVARAGYRGFRRGKPLVVPGLVNRLGTVAGRLAPRWLPRKVAKTLHWSE
ncbi:MAG: SDR family oxidoreductase [Thermoguttaceae bacterium]|jgi:short-subunit dehydrogenase